MYTNLAVLVDDPDYIVAAVVGSHVNAFSLSAATRQLLVPYAEYHNQQNGTRNQQHQPKLFYIMTLGCRSEYRHRGLARQLVQKCIHDCAASDYDCQAVYLHVLVSNRAAVQLYEQLKFHRVQEIPGYYQIVRPLNDSNDTASSNSTNATETTTATTTTESHACYLYAQYFHGNPGHLHWRRRLKEVWQKVVVRTYTVIEHRWRHYTLALLALAANNNDSNERPHNQIAANDRASSSSIDRC